MVATTPFVFLLCIQFISSYVLINDEETEIVWPDEYHFKGEKYNFDTSLKEPFEVWRSAETNRSRIDFYGGSSKLYIDEEAGFVYSIFPMTNANLSSQIACQFMFTMEGGDFLPDFSALSYTGQTMTLFDKVVDIWTGKDKYEDTLIREQILYVYKTNDGFDIPVQHITKIFDEVRGAVDSHVVKNYFNFEYSVSPEDVKIPEDYDCDYFGHVGKDFKKDIQILHPDIPSNVDLAYNSYATHHSKQYHEKETEMRKQIFQKNWRMVHEHNRKNKGYRMELNQFSDRTPEELKYLTGTFVSNKPSDAALPFPHTLQETHAIVDELPQDFDLRLEGVVTQVKNQGHCGSCWAFATTAAVEGVVARYNGARLVDLSEQSLVDCAWNYDNLGCDGGILDGVWKYVLENGIPTEREYGVYIEHNGFCKILNMTTIYKIKGFAQVPPRNANAMKVALYKYGPVTVGLHASDKMLHYSNGVFYDFECEDKYARPNHAVTVVGYGVRDGEDYWLIKNSWSEAWGEDGYILMSARNNNCLVLDYAYYPIL